MTADGPSDTFLIVPFATLVSHRIKGSSSSVSHPGGASILSEQVSRIHAVDDPLFDRVVCLFATSSRFEHLPNRTLCNRNMAKTKPNKATKTPAEEPHGYEFLGP
jgi:hypothetical protein